MITTQKPPPNHPWYFDFRYRANNNQQPVHPFYTEWRTVCETARGFDIRVTQINAKVPIFYLRSRADHRFFTWVKSIDEGEVWLVKDGSRFDDLVAAVTYACATFEYDL